MSSDQMIWQDEQILQLWADMEDALGEIPWADDIDAPVPYTLIRRIP